MLKKITILILIVITVASIIAITKKWMMWDDERDQYMSAHEYHGLD